MTAGAPVRPSARDCVWKCRHPLTQSERSNSLRTTLAEPVPGDRRRVARSKPGLPTGSLGSVPWLADRTMEECREKARELSGEAVELLRTCLVLGRIRKPRARGSQLDFCQESFPAAERTGRWRQASPRRDRVLRESSGRFRADPTRCPRHTPRVRLLPRRGGPGTQPRCSGNPPEKRS
jgi:hypothetical protein